MKWMGLAAACCLGMVMHARTGSAQPTYSVIWQFTGGADGATPVGRVLMDPAGGLFGTTGNGGASFMGVVYHLSPPATPTDPWQQTTLYSFSGTDGRTPLSDLVLGAGRVLFGTTFNGGAYDSGTVFRLDPPQSGIGAWTHTTLHDFTGGGDGGNPYGGLAQCGSFLCGVTTVGGTSGGLGTVFRVAQSPGAGGITQYEVLLPFQGGAGGSAPYATLTVAPDGTLFGTDSGYVSGDGGVFSLGPVPGHPRQTPWTETVIHNFLYSATDGFVPLSPLLRDTGGTLYGVTYDGGTAGGGSVYRLAPPVEGGTGWAETVLASLPYECNPQGGLVPDGRGGLLGTTTACGASGLGTIFRAFPPVGGGDAWRLRDLHDFAGGADGSGPIAGLTRAGPGIYYGTTSGGSNNAGTVFAITP